MLSARELSIVQHLYICAMLKIKPSKEFQGEVKRLIQKQLVARNAAYDDAYDLPTWYRTIQQLEKEK